MNQLPQEIIGHVFDFLDRNDLYAMLKCYPGFVSNCCHHIRFKLMYNFISELEYDNSHQPTFKSKRKKRTRIRHRHFRRGEEYWENSKKFTPRQTLMIFYPKKSLKVLFETVGPYLLSKINNWKPFVERDEKMIKKFYYHFYNIKLSLELFESRICNSTIYCRTSFSSKSLETCLDITKIYKTRLLKLNTIIATEHLENLRNEFYAAYTKLVKEYKVNNEFLEVWNEKFKLTNNILSYSKSVQNSKKAISFIITTLWTTHDNMLDFLPLLRGLDRTNSSKRTDASRILLDICASKTTISVNSDQHLKRIQNLLECCSYFKHSISEFKTLLERFFDKMVVVPEMKEELNSLKTRVFNKYE
ncbi:predicted protein [Naegleria gruberi]|uniref:Predicted protein n=1 Tax=Naegleria gruberi TaxID=5762 RepID=D2VGP9_NAEGR|nr:uncharacterized protein NAEGRDRAFT_68054 [Naegleria gruberi]EFC44006.1 predicted protein [Naegleria gruberi]|eukprot:XP_002676750.1 predicted protein [Naegleria gruberi strain NEG-M]